MADKKVAQEWLDKADQDFGFSSTSLPEVDHYDQVCFFFQQAGEKYLKAYIVRYDLLFEKEHNLLRILEICKRRDPEFEKIREACKILTPFYTETRYPNAVRVIFTKEDAEKAKETAKKIGDFVKTKIK
jgi:HEPN domain-containing protein